MRPHVKLPCDSVHPLTRTAARLDSDRLRYFWFVVYVAMMGYIIWWLAGSVRRRETHEIYAATGLGFYFSEIFLSGFGPHLDIVPVRIIGFVLYVPAAIIVILGFITLHHKGRPKTGWEPTTTVISTGVFRLTRHPLFFGAALWAFAAVLTYQSLVAVVLAPVSIFCLYRASVGDEAATRDKFGAEYDIYCRQVPRWNVIAGLVRLLRNR